MKKSFLVLLVLLTLTGCKKNLKEYSNPLVESLPLASLKGYVDVPSSSNLVKKGDYEIADRLAENQGDFVLYFGFPKCPFCFDFFPVFYEVADSYQVPVVYLNVAAIDESMGGNGASEYDPYFIIFMERYDVYLDYNENGEKELFMPFVLFIKQGEVVYSHIGTVDNHDAHVEPLSDAQKDKLKKILEKGFAKLLS